jgi:hypothetical protein
MSWGNVTTALQAFTTTGDLMHCFYPGGLLPVQFAVGETLEIGKLDYPALRIDLSGNEANSPHYRFSAKPRRQHVNMTHAV